MKKEEGITLIALVITIIILLILAGIAIAMLTGENRILKNASKAGEETIKTQLKEEIELAIVEIQTEELPRGNKVTLETLVNGQLQDKLQDILAEMGNDEIHGEYKNYDYIIDHNFRVEVGNKAEGAKPSITAEILTTGYVLTGNEIEIKVKTSIVEGTVTIEIPEGATLKTSISDTEKVYTVLENRNYIFTAVGSNGRKSAITININQFIEKPQIQVTAKTDHTITIQVKNAPEEGIEVKYDYYVNNTLHQADTTGKTVLLENLASGTEYSVKAVLKYNGLTIESDVLTVTTTGIRKEALEYPMITADGVKNVKYVNNGTVTYDLDLTAEECSGGGAAPKSLYDGDMDTFVNFGNNNWGRFGSV